MPYLGELTVKLPDGRKIRSQYSRAVTYDTSGDIATLTRTTTVDDGLGHDQKQHVSTYDVTAGTVTTTSPVGRETETFLDGNGKVTEVDPDGPNVSALFPTVYHYDTVTGRLKGVTQGDRETDYAYDSSGYLYTVKRLVGHDTNNHPIYDTYTYTDRDADGRKTQVLSPDGYTTGLGYDDNGNLQTLTPPGQPDHTFVSGPLNLPTVYEPPAPDPNDPNTPNAATTVSSEYTADGFLDLTTRAEQGNPNTDTVDPEYDGYGRLHTVTQEPWGSTATYSYQLGGAKLLDNVVLSGDLIDDQAPDNPGSETTSFGYFDPSSPNSDGSTVSSVTWSGPVAGSLSYDYSAYYTDNTITETANDDGGAYAVYSYDNDDILVSAGLHGETSMALTADPNNGILTGRTLDNFTDTLTPNGYGEIDDDVAQVSSSDVYQRHVTSRDLVGRILTENETVGTGATNATTVSVQYQYTGDGQLAEVDDSNNNNSAIEQFTYDANGNRTSAKYTNLTGAPPNVSLGTVVIDGLDEMTGYGNLSITYDKNGQVTSIKDIGTGDTTDYVYDQMGILRQVTMPNGDVIKYLVDAEGRRIGREVNGSLTDTWLYNGNRRPVVWIHDPDTTNVRTRFVYGRQPMTPAYMVQSGTKYVFVTNAVGSPRAIVNASDGSIKQQIDYDAFGYQLSNSAPTFQPFGFAGGLVDPETGLVSMGAREYNPKLGRWMTRDPYGFPDGGNRYAYASSDPINNVDPSGFLSVRSVLAGAGNSVAGFADGLTAGFSGWALRKVGLGGIVDPCSACYRFSQAGGTITGLLVPGGGEVEAGADFLRGEEVVVDAAEVGGGGGAISMDEAVERGANHVGGRGEMEITGRGDASYGNYQFRVTEDGETRVSRFDVNPNNSTVQKVGPHLNLETWSSDGTHTNVHFPIDPTTVRPGDCPQ